MTGRTDVAVRPYAVDDLPLLQRLLGDPTMMVHLGGPESPEAILARHERYLRSDDSVVSLFTVVVGPRHTPAGWVGFWESSWQGEDVWECGWSVLPGLQGSGVATAATALMLEHARGRGERRYMHAFPSVDNVASNSLCRRLGFKLLGEVDVEYPKGSVMRANGWRFDLRGKSAD